MKKISCLFLILILHYSITNACSCGAVASFCEVNFHETNWNSFIGKVVRHDSLFTEFEILDNLRGNETRDTIII